MNQGIFSGISLGNMINTGGTLNYQEFLSSGTFYPPARLLAKGGKVFIELRGGGGGGGGGNTSSAIGGGGGGGSSRHITIVTIPSMEPIAVTLGAGGAGGAAAASGLAGSDGDTSTFGNLLTVLGGKKGMAGNYTSSQYMPGGRGEGNNGVTGSPGGISYYGVTQSWADSYGGNGGGLGGGMGKFNGTGTHAALYQDAVANSGGGGGGGAGNVNGGTGGSGYCIIWWFE